ncbi:MAG TPA: 23S rRNA (adenine(2503)-C(2))-methyltransferase RlmN [Candidatus Marinimicrobia bacterium]|nr:23S rRNA (adenine(2503)-C(2))-methyltransferase RlmN [Candidatus Neomarinimicrobiota bacterium]
MCSNNCKTVLRNKNICADNYLQYSLFVSCSSGKRLILRVNIRNKGNLQMDEKNIKGLTLPELENWVAEIGESPFRAKQIYRWMYQRGVRSFEEMSDLSKSLRNKLAQMASVSMLQIDTRFRSKTDQSVKYLFRLSDGNAVEAVYMVEGKRITLCLSTMVGCPVGCAYCATGIMGFKRNLTAGEIVDQLLLIQQDQQKKATNIVFMGMGEPFLNYDNVIKAASILNSELGQEIAARRIIISTAGIIPAIHRFADEGHRFKLAISLNASTDAQRDELVPVNLKHPLWELMAAVKYYTDRSKRRVTFEYILIKDFNDTPQDARRLIKMLGQIPCKLNIIPYNQNEFLLYKTPSEDKLNNFLKDLYQAPFAVTVRRSKGLDIAAACGQLYIRDKSKI